MSSSQTPRRPSLDAGKDLFEALRALHLQAGQPSSRQIERDLGRTLSHTTINNLLKGPRIPKWPILEQILVALSASAKIEEEATVSRFRKLWIEASTLAMGEKSGDIPPPPELVQQSKVELARLNALFPYLLDEIEIVAARDGATSFRIPCGFADLDTLVGGWSFGSLVTISGASACGRTTLLLDFCKTAAIKHGLATLLVSADMNPQELQFRILSAECRVPLHSIRTGYMADDDWSRLARKLVEVAEAPLWMTTMPRLNFDEIKTYAESLKQRNELRLLAIDGLSLGREGGLRTGISLELLKELAMDLNLAVIVAMRGANLENPWRRPNVSEFPEWGEVERVADIGIVIHREDHRDPLSPRAGEADLMVVKNRNGPTYTCTVAYQAHYARFVDMFPPASSNASEPEKATAPESADASTEVDATGIPTETEGGAEV